MVGTRFMTKHLIITWRTFNLEDLFVYKFEPKFLSNCVIRISS